MLPCADSNDICDALFVGSHGLYEIFLLLDACKWTLECHTPPASKIFCTSSYDFRIFLTCFPEWPVSRHFFFFFFRNSWTLRAEKTCVRQGFFAMLIPNLLWGNRFTTEDAVSL